jgi:hypothetical protein
MEDEALRRDLTLRYDAASVNFIEDRRENARHFWIDRPESLF